MDAERLVLVARSQYGNVRMFAEGHLAPAVRLMTGRKTVEPRDVEALAVLGIVPEIMANALDVDAWRAAQRAGIETAKNPTNWVLA